MMKGDTPLPLLLHGACRFMEAKAGLLPLPITPPPTQHPVYGGESRGAGTRAACTSHRGGWGWTLPASTSRGPRTWGMVGTEPVLFLQFGAGGTLWASVAHDAGARGLTQPHPSPSRPAHSNCQPNGCGHSRNVRKGHVLPQRLGHHTI